MTVAPPSPAVPPPSGTLPQGAADRAALLAEYGLPDHAPVEQLRQLTQVAAALCGTPTAVVNLLDGCFQHQIGGFGFDGGTLPLADSLCAVALRDPRLRHIPDARVEPAFAGNPWVDGRLAQLRFYASAPMVLADGRVLGTLCVLSEQVGSLSAMQRQALAGLAAQAVAQFEQVRQAREAERQASLFRLVAEGSADVLSRQRPDGTVLYVSPSVRAVLGHDPHAEVGRLLSDRVHPDDQPARVAALQSVLDGSREDVTVLSRLRHADGSWRWMEARLAPIRGDDSRVLEIHSAARDVTERIEAQRRRTESEQRYRAVVEHSPEAIVVHVDGRIAFANPGAARLLGADAPDELVGTPIASWTDPDLAAVTSERVAMALAGRDTPPLRQRLRRLDGQWVQVESSGARVELDGRIGVQNVIRDVTDAEAAREALRVSEQQHRVLFDAAAVGMFETDDQGVLLRANPALARLLRYEHPSVLVGRHVTELIHADDRSGFDERRQHILSGQTDGWDLDAVQARSDGSPVEVVISGRVLRRPDGTVRRYLSTVVDMTERVAARRALEAANAQLATSRDEAERRGAMTAAVLDTIDVGVVACDAAGGLTLFNRAARAFHGVPEDPTADPADWADRYCLYDEDGVTPLLRDQVPLFRTLVDGRVRDVTIVIAPAGMPPRTVRCDGQAMRDASGRLLGAVIALKDVTQARARARELTEARDQALAATRAKTAFLAAASHEIRTPLNGVLGTLELLSVGTLSPRQAEYVQVAQRSGEALLTLLNDVLDLSKSETTSVILASEPFSPYDVAGDVLAALGPVARRKGLGLDLRTGPDELLVGDPARLRQVLMNLVGNAVKFTADGRVRVDVAIDPATSRATRRLRLSVSDTGTGMDADEVSRLFQPFVQGTQGQRHGGTGLGLALSQQLVDLMGGRITVSSEPGRGSQFCVDVELPHAVQPCPPQAAAPAGATFSRPAPPPGGDQVRNARLRVLVADDSDVNLMVAEALLALEGAEVVTVRDGDEAVQAVRDERFDLVLLDNRMARMSGLDAARAIRALPGPAGRTRLLALTASASEEDRAAFADAGMQGVLHKPVRGEDLRKALSDAAELHQPGSSG